MFESFGIIDFIDIALASALLLYLYLTMKKSGAINVFLGIVFLLVVFTVLRISRMTLMKGIFDTIISQGVIILIILFQNEIRHFLSDVGSNRSLRFFNLPRYLGLRHRSALGITQESDAVAIVVSEETGNISCAYKGEIFLKLSSTELDHKVSELLNE